MFQEDTPQKPNAMQQLDQLINTFQPDGKLDFEDDGYNDLFAAVATLANNSKPLPENPQEIDDFLESIPLFATKPPERGKESEAFLALQALQQSQEVPDDQLVEKFKEAGNNSYRLALRLSESKPKESDADRDRRIKARKVKIYDALNHYYSAVENGDKLYNNEADDRTKEEKDRVISLIYGNIAAAHLLLENHGHCVDECKRAIRLWKENIKCYYRMAQSLFKLHKYPQSFVVIQQGMQRCIAAKSATEYKQFVVLAQQVTVAWKRNEEYMQGKYKEKQAKLQQDSEELKAAKALCEKRKIPIGVPQFNMSNQYQGKIYVGAKKELHFPVIFLYPLLNQSDFMQDVDEYTTIEDMLNMLFPAGGAPAPWDAGNQYRQGNMRVWVRVGKAQSFVEDSMRVDSTTGAGVEVEVPLKAGLGHALQTLAKKGYIVPGWPTFCVTPKQ